MEALLIALVCLTGALIPVARNHDRQLDREEHEMTATTTAPAVEIIIEATHVKTEVTYTATFATDAQAAEFVARKSSTHCFSVADGWDELAAPLTTEAIYPTCEHGLSAQLCGGPMHWYDR